MAKPVKMECWVMRVIRRADGTPVTMADCTLAAYVAVGALIDRGELALVDGVVLEPLEVFDDDEEAAHAHHAALKKKHPTEDFRVILNADIPV